MWRCLRAGWFVCVFLSVDVLADKALVLGTPQKAAQARIDLIRDSDEIYVEYFSIGDDQSAVEFLALLEEAAKQGKKVHLITDGVGEMINKSELTFFMTLLKNDIEGAEIPPRIMKALMKSGVDIQFFNHLRTQPLRKLPIRSHSKLLIGVKKNPGGKHQVRFITGSRNVKDGYYGRGAAPHRETDIFIDGNAAEEALMYYKGILKSKHLDPPQDMVSIQRSDVALAHSELEAARERLRKNRLIDYGPESRTPSVGERVRLDQAIEVGDVDFYHHNPDRTTGSHRDIIREIRNAQTSILIANPYFLPTDGIREALADAVKRNVKVRILTNSRRSTDQRLVQSAFEMDLPELAKMGLEIWEYNRSNLLHKKDFVIDGKTASVGTYNFDPRSMNFQLEVGVIVRNEEIAREVTKNIQRELRDSRLLAKDGRLLVTQPCQAWYKKLWIKLIKPQI